MYKIGDEIRPTNPIASGAAPGQASFSYGQVSQNAPGKIKGIRTVGGKTYYDIDQTYIGGGTGWIDASSLGAPSSPTPATSPQAQPGTSAPAPSTNRLDFINTLVSQFKTDEAARQQKSTDARQKLVDYYAGLEDPTQRYMRFREEQGLPQQQALVDALTRDVMKGQDNLEALEGDINKRVGDFLINDTGRASLYARESDPLIKNINTLLRNKQYEEVGLQGRQNLVSELLQLSFKNDEMKAKPLQLGVDFTDSDAQAAREIFRDLATRQTNAYFEDMDSADADRRSSEDFARQIALENLRTQNDITAYNATTGANKAQGDAKKAAQDKAKNVYNKLLGSFKTENEVWQYLMNNREKGQNFVGQGIMDELWELHGNLKASIGQSAIKKNAGASDDWLSSYGL